MRKRQDYLKFNLINSSDLSFEGLKASIVFLKSLCIGFELSDKRSHSFSNGCINSII